MIKKKIFVIGGDGFCGWPISLKLSKEDNEVTILDNLSRRNIDNELGTNSLTNISTIEERIETWESKTGKKINFYNINVAKEFDRLVNLLKEHSPDTIIHLGEQRAAPYSMKSSKTKRYTVDNNLNATHNILAAIVESKKDIHLVHMGTMGVYGYGAVPDTIIPEGYIDIKMKNSSGDFMDTKILHPAYPGSIYHMTKTQDALFFQFYAKNYKIRITDLHQGIIWGLHTDETKLDEKLVNRFDYDSDYGTCLNRFIMQSAYDIPLTIYGTGGQTRAFIHIKDSAQCVNIAVNNPPSSGEPVKIFNQMTETHNLLYLADVIKKVNPDTKVEFCDNPRNELVKNDLVVSNKQFLDLGLKPIYLDEEHIKEIFDSIKSNKNRVNMKFIKPMSFWKN